MLKVIHDGDNKISSAVAEGIVDGNEIAGLQEAFCPDHKTRKTSVEDGVGEEGEDLATN